VTRRFLLALFFAPSVDAQQSKTAPAQPQQQEPPEEDETLAPKEYTFNPLQATKEVKIGSYYFKKGNYRAAAKRFTEATRWNPNFAEAFLRLGEANEKLKDDAGARQAYSKYLELAPDAKNSEAVRKKLARKR
jgi:Flp pilus assembly protein TadD